jgi:hypothetical protein
MARGRLYSSAAGSDLYGLHGSENWVLTEKDKSTIQAAEMRLSRSTMGVKRQERLTNEAISKVSKVK